MGFAEVQLPGCHSIASKSRGAIKMHDKRWRSTDSFVHQLGRSERPFLPKATKALGKYMLLTSGLLALLNGCGSGVDNVPAGESTSSSQPLYVSNRVTLWTANGNVVPVCWSSTGFDTEKRWIQQIVENTWGKVANLRFIGWQQCPTTGTQKFVKVNLYTDNTIESNGNTDFPFGMGDYRLPTEASSLNIHINSTRTQGRVEYLGVHEFGHVLGFLHEQSRPDNPDDRSKDPAYCKDLSVDSNGNYVSAYDRDSIMNYCNKYGNNRGYLSATDVFGVQQVYGRKPGGSIVGFDGRCVDVQGGVNAAGTPVQTWECYTSPNGTAAKNQSWLMDLRFQVFEWLGGTNKMLDVQWSNTANGTPVWIWDKNGTAAQTWSMPNAALKAIGGMCLDVPAFSKSNGVGIQLWECLGGANQKWTFMPDGSIRLNDPYYGGTKCLDVDNSRGFPTNGTRVQLWDCNGGQNQKFSFGYGGQIQVMNTQGNLCLDVPLPDVNTFNGKNGQYFLQVWACNGRPNQKFTVEGDIRGVGNKCLDVDIGNPAGGRQNGNKIQIWDCVNNPNQKWELWDL